MARVFSGWNLKRLVMESLWRLYHLGFLPWLLWLELPKLCWVKVVSVGMLCLSCSCPLTCSCCGTDWGTLRQLQICCMGQTLSPRASQGWPSMDLCWVFSAWHGSVLVSYLALCFPLGTNLWLWVCMSEVLILSLSLTVYILLLRPSKASLSHVSRIWSILTKASDAQKGHDLGAFLL